MFTAFRSYLLSVWVAPLASLAALARRGKGHNEPIPQRRRLQASATQLRRQRRSRQLKRGPETTLGATCVPTTRSETTLEATLGTTCTQTTPPETTLEATWVTKAPPERSKNLRRGRKNGCPKMSQNGLPGAPKKAPKMSPLKGPYFRHVFEKEAVFQNLRWTRNGKRVSIHAISRARGRDFSELSPTSTQPQTATERHGQTTTMTFEGREPQ